MFVGCDPDVDNGIFGKIDAAEFASDAASLRAVNEVYAEASVDEQELAKWPKDGSLPASIRECCIQIEADASEVPGTIGPASMTSNDDMADAVSVPPWTSAIDPAPEDDTSAAVMGSTLSSKLEMAADLGARIRIHEAEARIENSTDVADEVSRELLLKTCGTLKKSFQRPVSYTHLTLPTKA